MTHELIKIFRAYQAAKEKGIQAALATVVALEGSSYRRPGVCMLLLENGEMTGAVSGGCVEKEIFRQTESVFKSQTPRMMTYDGRYRLGCEGILYILIEPFIPDDTFLSSFWDVVRLRQQFAVSSYYSKVEGTDHQFGSCLQFQDDLFPLRPGFTPGPDKEVLSQVMNPCFKLLIVGAEHDAVQLCAFAALTGWEVVVIAPPTEEKNSTDFPGAREFYALLPEDLPVSDIDQQTAVVIMTHNYARDLQFLIRIKNVEPVYVGLLGPAKRREKLLAEILERVPDIPLEFFDRLHGPAGLNIGAETPQEIALAILTEILTVIRDKEPMPLKDKKANIHN